MPKIFLLKLKAHFRFSLIFFCATSLSSCISLAPDGIRDNRIDFNQSVQETNTKQLLLNLVRASNYESPVFTVVAEQDIATSATSSIAGGSNNINAALPLGMITGTFSTSQSPTNRILIPYGNELVNQYDRPISAQSINNLFQSNYPIASIIDFSIQRLTPNYLYYDITSNILFALDGFGALDIANNGTERLIITLRSEGALPTSAEDADQCFHGQNTRKVINKLWTSLLKIYGLKSGHTIFLDTHLQSGLKDRASYVISTRTAIGALKIAPEDKQVVKLNRATADRLISETEGNKIAFSRKPFYYLTEPSDEHHDASMTFAALWKKSCNVLLADTISDRAALEFRAINQKQVFIMLVETNERQPDAFSEVYYNRRWYSILDKDKISKHNLSLLAAILTIEAPPSQYTPLQPVLNVGAR